MFTSKGFPSQRLSYSRKNKAWRKACVDWADHKITANYSYIRNSLRHKKVNYDLLVGKLDMSDVKAILNPQGIRMNVVETEIAHYPIMLSKLNVLRGEESKRVFDYRVVVTNPTAVSDIERVKEQQLNAVLQEMLQNESQSEEEFMQKMEESVNYYNTTWQDEREIKGNALLSHYEKELNMPYIFNTGFVDAMAVAEEIYQCDIVCGEPTLERINPKNIQILRSGFSNRVEDADMIIMCSYWNPGRIIDTFGEALSPKDVKYLEDCDSNGTDSLEDERNGFVNVHMLSDKVDYNTPLEFQEVFSFDSALDNNAPFDNMGNIKVLRVFWKSYRYILNVKSFNPETGEEEFNLYSEDYKVREDLGEEVVRRYPVNEAWEGVKIGEDIYVNMRPRVIQYNRMSNPSRCHFGIIGTIYNINEERSYSLVDMMKQYNYLYDVIHDRLNRLMARNWGKLIRLDSSKKPGKWDFDKWLYYAKEMGFVIEDSFNAGTEGYATGKLAGAMNNATTGVIDAELGNTIQQYINLLEFIKLEMSEVAGITRQREGQVSNRETVGGVERATLQSSHITEWLFIQHEDLKKRVLEAFLETAKIACRGKKMKFKYILPDKSFMTVSIDEDDMFYECDHGLVVDNSQMTQEFAQKLETYAQAAMQNQATSFSTIFKLYGTASLAEKMRIVEKDEQQIQQRQQQAQQEQLQAQQQMAQQQMQLEQQRLAMQDQMNQRDNQTKLMIAGMNQETPEVEYSPEAKDKLMESMRQFDETFKLQKQELEEKKRSNRVNEELKRKQIAKQSSKTSSTK